MKKALRLAAVSFLVIFLCFWAKAICQSGPGTDPAAVQVGDKGIGPIKSVTLGPVDGAMADNGKAIFNEKCAMCHGLTEDKTGPAVGNVLSQVAPEFIMNFLLNTAEMEQKDPLVLGLIKKFGIPMPPPGLDQDQARAILEYLRTTKK